MKRLAAILLVAITACTPAEITRWKRQYFQGDQGTAIEHVQNNPIRCRAWCLNKIRNEPRRVRRLAWGSCRQWFDTSLRNGWRTSDWNTMNWVMYRESHCDPGATSPAGAIGLMQVMPFWADDCGGWPSKLYEPAFNLRCARYVWSQQGWNAWDVY